MQICATQNARTANLACQSETSAFTVDMNFERRI
jgi:hypothetical protein